jgi:hypothetical protein
MCLGHKLIFSIFFSGEHADTSNVSEHEVANVKDCEGNETDNEGRPEEQEYNYEEVDVEVSYCELNVPKLLL